MTNFEVTEPLTYRKDVRHSYFRDLVFAEREPSAAARLQRHAAEMADVSVARQQRALNALAGGGIEYRLSPDTTQGNGGYFTVPLWINDMFATAPRPHRLLAALIKAQFPLPNGVASVNLPILTKGTIVTPAVDDTPTASQAITDSPGSSVVETLIGEATVGVQLLEQSPAGAHMDWAIFTDMAAAYDAQVENQLFNGLGAAYHQILGVLNIANTVGVPYTSGSPTGSGLFALLGQALARVGNNRNLPPECWMMRSARWGWLASAEDTNGLPFGLPTFFLGDDDQSPDPFGGLIGLPIFANDTLPATQGTGANQDVVVALRPSDLILLEGSPVTNVYRDVLSGTLDVRLQMHNKVAAITNRYPSGISPITGTGMAVQTGFNN